MGVGMGGVSVGVEGLGAGRGRVSGCCVGREVGWGTGSGREEQARVFMWVVWVYVWAGSVQVWRVWVG